VACSKGTYIRSLAEDIASKLGTCGTVASLRRSAAGRFSLAEAYTLEQLQDLDNPTLHTLLLPVDTPLTDIPAIEVSAQESACIKQGQQITYSSSLSGQVRIYCQQTFLGLGEMSLNGKLIPRRLFNLESLAI
jgi:tRNA pseudouridine55 synthase